MKTTDIQNLVDQLCRQIDDLGPETAGGLSGRFVELAENLEESGCPETAAACLKAAELAGQVSREETEAAHGQQVLAKTMDEVRACLRANTAPASVTAAPDQMMDEEIQLVREFIEEATEHIAGFEDRIEALAGNPDDTAALEAVIRGFHTITGMAGYINLDQIKGLAKRSGNLLDMVRTREIDLTGNHRKIMLESIAKMQELIRELAQAVETSREPKDDPGLPDLWQRLDAITGRKSKTSAATAKTAAKGKGRTKPRPDPGNGPLAGSGLDRLKTIKEVRGVLPVSAPVAERKNPGEQPSALNASQLSAPAQAAELFPSQLNREPDEMVRIRAERLDQLVEAIGDLVVAESLVSQSEDLPRDKIPVNLAECLENLDRICRRLQKVGTSLELVPVEPLFREMEEQMSRLAARLGKEVDLVITGEAAELDQRLLSGLREPLAAILTGCLEQGIEASPAQRQEKGKPVRGRVKLTASSRRDHLTIEIRDDGTGLNEEISADAEIRRSIGRLQGTLAVAAEPGRGCKFIINLPLNPNLTDGLIIKVGPERCVLPAHAVLRLIRPQKKNLIRAFNQNEIVFFEGEPVPLVSLARLFGQLKSDPDPSRAMVVITEAEGRRIGFLVEELLGYQPVVIKKLNQAGGPLKAAAGAAVTADGSMALVLDIPHLVQATLGQETAEAGTATVGAGHSDGGL